MNSDSHKYEPLELWLQGKCKDGNNFPNKSTGYFDRYKIIKGYLNDHIYKYIGAATSAEDQGIYTDHSIDHFNSVIKYAGELLGLDVENKTPIPDQEIGLNPYEVFITLVSILLHDAGNISGRAGHEKRPLQIFMKMGEAAYYDEMEARPIAQIAQAHGGHVWTVHSPTDKDTIRNMGLDINSANGSTRYRPQLIAALVRFSDEICETRNRAARYMIDCNIVPIQSEIYHLYANSITSVTVDLPSRTISIRYETTKSKVIKKFGKNNGKQYLIDEINCRLEKMFSELRYCKAFMYPVVMIERIRATVQIYEDFNHDSDGIDDHGPLRTAKFQLVESGYPVSGYSFEKNHPEWCGKKVRKEIRRCGEKN